MRIAAVKRFLITDAARVGVYVKIETDTGQYEVGEATLGSSPRAVMGLLDDLEHWLVGTDGACPGGTARRATTLEVRACG